MLTCFKSENGKLKIDNTENVALYAYHINDSEDDTMRKAEEDAKHSQFDA